MDETKTSLHQLYGSARKRIFYKPTDYADYLLMLLATAAVVVLCYGDAPWLMGLGLGLAVLMAFSFPLRHGAAWAWPSLLREPQGLVLMLVYKLKNLKPMFFVALALLVLDGLFIRLTPDWPHHSEAMRKLALSLFILHLVLVSGYRTVILVAHLRHRSKVKSVLMETTWRSAFERQPNVLVHIFHAYITGLLTHLILLAPWYLVINHVQYSVISVVPLFILGIVVHCFYLQKYSEWFYRDHWLAHNAEFDFLYLHGTHHDAIPCGLIGVSGNGILEGLMRHTTANPMALYAPPLACLLHTIEVIQDIRMHQYIPGVYPVLPRSFHEVSQHSTHHFGRLEPYGIGLRMLKPGASESKRNWLGFPPESILNSIALDEQMNGFEWDNPRYQRFMEIYDRYQDGAQGQQMSSGPTTG